MQDQLWTFDAASLEEFLSCQNAVFSDHDSCQNVEEPYDLEVLNKIFQELQLKIEVSH